MRYYSPNFLMNEVSMPTCLKADSALRRVVTALGAALGFACAVALWLLNAVIIGMCVEDAAGRALTMPANYVILFQGCLISALALAVHYIIDRVYLPGKPFAVRALFCALQGLHTLWIPYAFIAICVYEIDKGLVNYPAFFSAFGFATALYIAAMCAAAVGLFLSALKVFRRNAQ